MNHIKPKPVKFTQIKPEPKPRANPKAKAKPPVKKPKEGKEG